MTRRIARQTDGTLREERDFGCAVAVCTAQRSRDRYVCDCHIVSAGGRMTLRADELYPRLSANVASERDAVLMFSRLFDECESMFAGRSHA